MHTVDEVVMMESPSPFSPGGSVLDRVLLFERKERESHWASSPQRILTKTPANEQQPPFSPRRVLAAVPKDSAGITMHFRGPSPTSPVNNVINDNINSFYKPDGSPNSDQTTYEIPRTRNPLSDRSTYGSRQELMTNLKPGVTFGKSPRSDHTLSPKPFVTFGRSPRSDQTSSKLTLQLDKSPRPDQTLSPKVFAFSKTHKPEQLPSLKSKSTTGCSNAPAPHILPLHTDTSFSLQKSHTSNLHSNHFKSFSSIQSPKRDATTNNVKSVSPRSRAEEQKGNLNPTLSQKSPDHFSNFKPFPITSRAVVLPTKNDQATTGAAPEPASVLSGAMTPRNAEQTFPFDQNSPTVRQRRNQFQNLSVSVNHNTGLISEEAVIEEVSWPSEELLSKKLATTGKKLSRGNEDPTLAIEEGAVEEMPWPSEVLEEFPELSWISSDDDCIESGNCSDDKSPTEKHVALEQRPTESKLTNGSERLRAHETQCNTLSNDDNLANKAQPIPADATTSYEPSRIPTAASNYISQPESHSSKPHQANKTQGKNIWQKNYNSKFQSSPSAFIAEEPVSDVQVSTSGWNADIFDAHRSKAPGNYTKSGYHKTDPLSINTNHVKKHMQETLQERDEEAQQRSESPSRGTRYTSLSRVMYEDSLAADIDDSVTVISSITAKSNVTISTEGSTGFTSRYCQLEEGLRQDVDSPSRTARMKRASRLRSLNSPISTNLLLEKSIELASQVHDNRLPEISDIDGPPKITIEPGKLTAGFRPRSISPTVVASNQHSITKPPDIGSMNVNVNAWKEISGTDTLHVIADSAASSGEKRLSSNMDIFCEVVLPRCSEPSEEQKCAEPTCSVDIPTKEGSLHQEVFKVPRSVSLRPELSQTLRAKNFARTPTKSLSGTNSNEDDIHSVATDSTPVTRPGRTFTAFEKTDESVHSVATDSTPVTCPGRTFTALGKTDESMLSQVVSNTFFKNDQLPLATPSQHQQTKLNSLNINKEIRQSITDELIIPSERYTTFSLSQYGNEDGHKSYSSIQINAEAVSSLPQLILPQSPGIPSTPKKKDRRGLQINTATIETPNNSLIQPVDNNIPHAEDISNAGINPRDNSYEHLNLSMQLRENDHEVQRVQIQEQQISPNRKKVHRKKSKKHVSLDSPSNRSASSSTSSTNENISVGSLPEDLASWWQSTYAAAQEPEVNHLIEKAILEKAVSPSNSPKGKRRVPILQSPQYQSSTSFHLSKSSLSGKSSLDVFNEISTTFLNSSTSCGNEGDSEGGSIGQLVASATSSQTSRNSNSVGKANLETDDDVFSGIEDDEQTLDSKLDRDNVAVKGGFKIHSLPDDGGGDISIKDTSTCDDTHTTDLLNALDEDNSQTAKPSLVPLNSLRVKKVEGMSVKTTAMVPREVTDIGGKPHSRVSPKPDDGVQENKNKAVSDEEIKKNPDIYVESSSSKGESSVNVLFEKFSCSFLEGFVVQFCQDPKKAGSNVIEALCQNPESSIERYTGSVAVKEEEIMKDREVESAASLSDASDFPEQEIEKNSSDTQAENIDVLVADKIESEVHFVEKKTPESFLDEIDVKKDVFNGAGAEDSSSTEVLQLPVTQSNASPKRMTFLSIGKATISCKVKPSSSAKSASSLVSARSSRAGQKQLLDRFCWKLLHDGMEVLKLSSDKIWQTRYLTVSQEVTLLSNEVGDDAKEVESSSIPKALLWVKKPPSGKDHSVNGIEKGGKGGILFSHVACVEELTGRHIPVSKKQLHGKFKDSATVVLKSTDEGGSKIVYFRCGTRQEALVLCAGCNMISKLLHTNKQPLLPLNSNKLPPSITSTSMEDTKSKAHVLESENVEIDGDNDLWEV